MIITCILFFYERMNITNNNINNHSFNRKEINSEHIYNRVFISDQTINVKDGCHPFRRPPG